MPIRHALRSLKRTPAFSLAVLLTLALGLSSVGSMFAIVHGVLLAPMPYGAPERLVSVGLGSAEVERMSQSPAIWFTYQRYARSLESVAIYRSGSANVRMSGGGDAESVMTTWVSASMMPLLQVAPLLGRSFNAEEEVRGGPNVVVLSESEWRSRFAAATDVIGKTLIINDAPREIIGVMPARFSFPTAATRFWLPVKHNDEASLGDFAYQGLARLAPGVSAEHAQAELGAVLPKVAEMLPRLKSGGSTATWLDEVRPRPIVLPLVDELTRGIAQTLWTLAAAAGLVLLVAWANVANLMLVRADAHQHEFAVRAALGASRLRVAGHYLGESLLLGAAAAVLALLASKGAVAALVMFGPADVPRLAELQVGLATAGFIALLAALGVLICAAVPALRLWRGSLPNQLHEGGRGQTAGKSRQRLRASITALQIAVGLVVLVGSALLLRTAHRLYEVQPGFDASEVTTLRVLLPFARYRDSSTVAFYARLTEQAAQLPSVRAVGLTWSLPLGSGGPMEQSFQVEGESRTKSLPVNVISNGYFGALGIPLLAGRDFRSLDAEQAGDIILSQRAAEALFGDSIGTAAVGKWLSLAPNGPRYTVVGVVGDVRDKDLAIAPTAMIYRPQSVPIDPRVEPGPRASMVLVLKSSLAAGEVVSAVRQIVRDLDPAVPVFEVMSMNDVVGASTARLHLTLTLMSAAALITLLLGMIGLYGVMAYMVALRTREFGVRIALGADPKRIGGWVVSRGLALTAGGIAAGLLLYAMAAPFLRAFLYGVTATDPIALIGAVLLLAGTAALASWLPARRAARVDPVQALRAE